MRKAFNFYKSYDDVIRELPDKQALEMYKTISDVQFFRKKIDDISFKDKMLTLVWKSLYHSIIKQLEGYCNSKSVTYNSLFLGVGDAYEGASGGAYEGAYKGASVQGEGEEQGQEEGGSKSPLRSDTISKSSSTTTNDELVTNAFEIIWKEHREYKQSFSDSGYGSKSVARKRFKATVKRISKTFKNIQDINDIFREIDEIVIKARREKYTPHLQNILDPDTIIDKIKDAINKG